MTEINGGIFPFSLKQVDTVEIDFTYDGTGNLIIDRNKKHYGDSL